MAEQYTPRFEATLMASNTIAPEAIFNRLAVIADVLLAGKAVNYTATPPGSPANGDVYIVGAGATGAWATQDEKIAIYFDGWDFRPAPQYFRLFVTTLGRYYVKGASVWSQDTVLSPLGRHTIGIPAGALVPATTNGCGNASQAESATHKVNYKYLPFDASTVEYASFSFPAPKSYNASTFKLKVRWAHGSGGTAFAVVWQVEMLSLTDNEAFDTAWGTAVQVTDTGGTANRIYTSPESAAITPSNTPAKGDYIFCRISRLATDGADTLDIDAQLIGVDLYYDTDASTDD